MMATAVSKCVVLVLVANEDCLLQRLESSFLSDPLSCVLRLHLLDVLTPMSGIETFD
jgi:hypothetical protein